MRKVVFCDFSRVDWGAKIHVGFTLGCRANSFQSIPQESDIIAKVSHNFHF